VKYIYQKVEPTNSNCLVGIACPVCGSEEPFRIVAQAMVLMYDNGSEEVTDIQWDDTDSIECYQCKHWATVAEFYIDNHEINKKINNKEEDK
jgi:hypothetical protein